MMYRSVTDPADNLARSWFGSWSESFGIDDPEELPEKYVKFLAQLPLIAVEPDYIFVHAGLDFDATEPITDSQPDHMLWQESGVADRRTLGGRVVVSGHRIKSIRTIRRSLNSDRIYLDNGAFNGGLPKKGNLVALNLDTKELILQPWLDDDGE
jgi:serine/threonine protein phosphatase 1